MQRLFGRIRRSAENRSQLLPSLPEQCGREAGEVLGVVDPLVRPRSDRDHHAGDLRLGPEACGRQGRNRRHVRQGADDDGQGTVHLCAGRCGEPLGHLLLDGHELSGALPVMREERDDEGAGDLVGQVGNKLERTASEGLL